MRTIVLIVTWLAHLTGWLTGGYSTRYLHYNLSEKAKGRLLALQGLLSFILAFGLTNNYVAKFNSFKELYSKNDLWIVVTAFILLIIFLIIFGSVITILTDRWRAKNEVKEINAGTGSLE